VNNYFNQLADKLITLLEGPEFLTASLVGESSDFVRLNNNKIRQAGNVTQMSVSVDLIEGKRHATASCDLSGNAELDLAVLGDVLSRLREQRTFLPEDPYINYATAVNNTTHTAPSSMPPTQEILDQIIAAGGNLDVVGILASGEMFQGFANSAGQRNWHSSSNFNFDWSVYHNRDKAIKLDYAGTQWDQGELKSRMHSAHEGLGILARPAKTIKPGAYRVYLAPTALRDIMNMMAWQGYGLKSHRTAQTPLIKMVKEDLKLHSAVHISENHQGGLAAKFTNEGFIKPDHVTLINAGAYQDCLVNARSAREYQQPVNAGSEYPGSLNMEAGDLLQEDILRQLHTGLYINNLWYCNFSDRNTCRITGMTRYWVENGTIVSPVNVMRFDESIYHMLGDKLAGLTKEREFLFDSSSYSQRSFASHYLPGALIDSFTLTL
jgi:predicted Zn-dependent protease